MTHTPGPWNVAHNGDLVVLGNPDTPNYDDIVMIADCENFQIGAPKQQQEANARLIAAAPDLLAALQALLDAIHEEQYAIANWDMDATEADIMIGKAEQKAREAIAKATQ